MPKYITAAEAARILGVTRQRVCGLIAEGKLQRVTPPGIGEGRACYVTKASVIARLSDLQKPSGTQSTHEGNSGNGEAGTVSNMPQVRAAGR